MKLTVRTVVAAGAIACLALASGCRQGATDRNETDAGDTANATDQPDASEAEASASPMSDEERRAYMQRHGVGFAGTDTDSDGRVTMEEAMAYARGPLTSGGDSDGDGAMSAAELAGAHPDVRAMLLRRDGDGDGAISSAEIDARVEATFEAADTDGDGALTEQEFQAAASAAPVE